MSEAGPHGSWPTPITSERVVHAARLPNGLAVDGDDLWWSEGRPEEAGRIAVLRRGAPRGFNRLLRGLRRNGRMSRLRVGRHALWGPR